MNENLNIRLIERCGSCNPLKFYIEKRFPTFFGGYRWIVVTQFKDVERARHCLDLLIQNEKKQ